MCTWSGCWRSYQATPQPSPWNADICVNSRRLCSPMSSASEASALVQYPSSRHIAWHASLKVLSHSSSHVDRCAGDVAGAVAGEECHDAGYLVRPPESAEWHLCGRELPEELLGRRVRRAPAVDVLPLRRGDEADVHAVDQDVLWA